jgi:hypothetical protein
VAFLLQGTHMNKGTLTILNDTTAVIGLPTGEIVWSPTEIDRYQALVTQWLKDGGVLSLPFAVDVIDKRHVNPMSDDYSGTTRGGIA